ncbi:MAG: hypothetical protein ACK5OA_09700, partial [Acidovorax sp.]
MLLFPWKEAKERSCFFIVGTSNWFDISICPGRDKGVAGRFCPLHRQMVEPKNGSWMHLPALLLGCQARRDDAAGSC